MSLKWKKTIFSLLTGMLLCVGIMQPEKVVAEESEVIVTSATELENALLSGETLIAISGEITVGDEADDSGKMIPLEIPANVTLRGADSDAVLYCRCPVQITGNNVIIRDLQMKFLSSNALGSVAHREIFLAGHSLTLDNVDTYQEGNGGALGGLGGTEEELLPTVYAGGFEGTAVADNAALIIQNSNEYTMFQALYMGHDTGDDAKESYTEEATLTVGAKTKVRDGIYVNQNAKAEIYVTGAEYSNLSSVAFYGNENTKLQIVSVSVNNATVDQIGTVIIKENGYLQLVAGNLKNVTVQSGGCLDLNGLTNVTVSGDFTGGTFDGLTDTRGVLVMNNAGTLNITGTATGSTILHTGNRYFTGAYTDGHTYVSVADEDVAESAFVLPDDELDYYELNCAAGEWTARELGSGGYTPAVIGAVEVLSSPDSVDVSKIISDDYVPAEQAPYCNVVWKDENGKAYTAEEVCEQIFYANDMVIAIRSEYWTSDAYDEKTDWGVPVWFEMDKESPEYCYFYTESDYEIISGSYTYLFCNTYFEDLGDVADVKAQLEGKVMAQFEVVFYDSSKGETPEAPDDSDDENPQEPTPGGTGEKEPQPPVHVHDAGEKKITPARPGKSGVIKTVCTSCGTILKSETIAAPKTLKLSKTEYTYSGKLCKPKVALKDSKGAIIDKSNYVITYKNNKKVGKATVVVSLKGKYSGTVKKTFKILPKKTSVVKIKSQSKKFVVQWKKISSQISGYQIQYSTSKKFTKKTTKSVFVKSKKTVKKTIRKPKAGKKYYVRIRTYKNVKISGKTKKYYSAWSKVKAAK